MDPRRSRVRRSAQVGPVRRQAEFTTDGSGHGGVRGPEEFGGELNLLPALLDGVDQRLAVDPVLLGFGGFVGLPGVAAHVSGALGFDLGQKGGVESGGPVGLSESVVKSALYKLRQRFASARRDDIAHTVASPAEVEAELRELLAALMARMDWRQENTGRRGRS